jgi:DNA-binding NarL/FixJ family response regulator
MKQQRRLLVDSNPRRVQELRDAMANVMLPPPVHREDGESAVLWVGANACDLCIISHELPGIDGLEALVRMRSRQPGLQAIMLAESTDQNVAIAAFRTGVVDFIPARGDYARLVARHAQQIAGSGENSATSSTYAEDDPTLSHIPQERLAPTYQNRLRAIGRQLDMYGFHTVSIIEVEGGFLVRAQKQRARRPQTLEFLNRDFPRLVASAIHDDITGDDKPFHQSELTPTGYEDLLRAVGYKLDQMSAEAIVLTELKEMFLVAGRGNDEMSALPGVVPFNLFLKQEEIESMLNTAFNRRGKEQPKVTRPAAKQGGLRNILRRLN